MKTYFRLAALALLLFSCSRPGADHRHIERKAIVGIWWSPQMFQSAAFDIRDSTIYYPDDFKEYRYDLTGDTLLIYQDEGYVLRSVILKATADTLVLLTQGFEETYTRSETPMP